MTNWKLVRLNFNRTPAHFGTVGIGMEETSERVHSDTLFSAWISAYARLYPENKQVEDLLAKFPRQNEDKEPPFRLSSTFIYQKNKNDCTYYLPKPLEFPPNYPIGDDLNFTKAYKKLNFLPLQVWQRWYQGEGFVRDKDSPQLETYKTSYSNAYKTQRTPRVAIDRNTSASNFYHTGFVQYQWQSDKQSGLYFLINFPQADPQLEQELQAALMFLGEEGLGGERSCGAGRFKPKWEELPETWQEVVNFKPSSPGKHSLISLFWQQPLRENFLENASYNLQDRGGWLLSYQRRRKMVRMFSEGSVFPQPPAGQLANVTPPKFSGHTIYRSGIALGLPVLTYVDA